MNRDREIRNFRKKKIFPLIAIIIVAIVILLVVEGIVLDVMVRNIIGQKMSAGRYASNELADVVEKKIKNGEYMYQVIEDISDDNNIYVIVDKNGKVVASSEQLNFVLVDIDIKIVSDSFQIAYDYKRKTEFLISSFNAVTFDTDTAEFSFNVFNIIRNVWKYGKSDNKVIGMQTWFKSKDICEGEYFLYRYDSVNVTNKEIFNNVLIGSLALVLFLMIIIVFALNIVGLLRNHRNKLDSLFVDMRTGSTNWFYFKEKAEKLLKGKNNRFAIVNLENINYEQYCAEYGKDAGDELLKQIAKYLEIFVCDNEIYARNTGDTFGILLLYEDDKVFHERMKKLVSEIESIVGAEGIHLGIFVKDKFENKDEVLEEKWQSEIELFYHYAQDASDSIKDNAKSAIAYFDDKLLKKHMWEHNVETKMEKALDCEEFVVYLQPKYDPSTSRLKGAEALIRWVNAEYGFIPPSKFIPIFEHNGFVKKIDDYMISHVSKIQKEWMDAGYRIVPISVNISRVHFADKNLAEHICDLVDEYKIPHEYIELELTESAFFDDKEILLKTIKQLQELGFAVSMDDFGTGYSSLNSLKDLPLNVLKLDAEFFRGAENERSEKIISKAIELAKVLDMEIVAEGVEREEQVKFLTEAGCDLIQGFYYDKPMPVKEFETRLEKM